MQAGSHNQGDIIWIKHELTERYYELKYNSGYSAAHDFAQKKYDVEPWKALNNYYELAQSFADPFTNYADPSQSVFDISDLLQSPADPSNNYSAPSQNEF